jgi:hypothetical protein
MDIYNWMILNKELLKTFYGLIIGIICMIIVIKTDKLFRLSLHQGIRYFRNAFFFYGLAFIMRYFVGSDYFFSGGGDLYHSLLQIFFEFFLIMAGFSLLYSLIWKKFETEKISISSLFNIRAVIFYLMAIIIVALDFIWQTYSFMFISQIILFIIAGLISGVNCIREGDKHKFLKFYFLAMVLSLAAWLTNAIIALYFNWHKIGLIDIYVLNIIIFLLFLFGVIIVTKK